MTYNFHQNSTFSRDYFKNYDEITSHALTSCTYTFYAYFYNLKKIHITCHTRNCHYDAQNSDDDHNTHGKNITKSYCKYQNYMALNWKKSCKKLNKNAQKYTYQEENLAHIFFYQF